MSKTATKPVTNHQSDEPSKPVLNVTKKATFLYQCCQKCDPATFNHFQEVFTSEGLDATNEKSAFLPKHCHDCLSCSQKNFNYLETTSQKEQIKIKENYAFLMENYEKGDPKIFDRIDYLENVLLTHEKAFELLDLDENAYYAVIGEIASELIFRLKTNEKDSLNESELKFMKKTGEKFSFPFNSLPDLDSLLDRVKFSPEKLSSQDFPQTGFIPCLVNPGKTYHPLPNLREGIIAHSLITDIPKILAESNEAETETILGRLLEKDGFSLIATNRSPSEYLSAIL